MKNIRFLTLIIIMSLAAVSFAAPGVINYQGRLTDSSGDPITTTVNVKFTFWDQETGGNQLGIGFADTDSVTPDAEGIYSTLIGDDPGNLIPESVFSGDSVWLNVMVGVEDLFPRMRITSVGFALKSSNADNASHASSADNATDVLRIVRDFTVETGESITAGDVVSFINGKIRRGVGGGYGSEYVFNTASTQYISAAALSDSKFVVVYRDDGNFSYGTAVVGTVSGGVISWGMEYVFSAAGVHFTSVAALSDSKFVVVYGGGGDVGTAIVGTVSGSALTFGSANVFKANTTDYYSVIALSDSKFVVAYRDWVNSYYGTTIVGTVSGLAISYGSEYVFNAAYSYIISATTLSDTKFVVAYCDAGNSDYGTAIVGTVSGGVISYGSEYVFNSASTAYFISAVALSDSKFVAAYQDAGNSNYGTAIVGMVSGGVISYGSEYVFNSANTADISLAALGDAKFAAAYRDNGNSNYGTAIVGTVSGTLLNFSSEYVFNNAFTQYISAAALCDAKFVAAYRDDGNSNYGTAFIGDFSEPFGIANTSASSGEKLPVILHGISDHHTSLTPGAIYYGKTDGSLTKIRNAYRIGRAVSPTELLLGMER